MRKLLANVVLAAVPAIAHSQTGTPVWLEATANDAVGRQMVFATKEAIRRSAGLRLVDRQRDARISLHLVTLDPDSADAGSHRTIYSAVWTLQTFHDTPVDMYSTQYVGTCGRNRVDGCAQGLVAITDEQSSMVRQWILDALEREKK